ncbi:hypothetical protein NDU88_005504 [Pleurodeles waltl]|uniref:Uncharacterized protein n=1 Tax=Pleurodeles waltl TaxID=8319 RepID=A0AAV7MAP3_PLEWA|nr:hypothetical protein NDU88_005504 [Pleurodeles waltl]
MHLWWWRQARKCGGVGCGAAGSPAPPLLHSHSRLAAVMLQPRMHCAGRTGERVRQNQRKRPSTPHGEPYGFELSSPDLWGFWTAGFGEELLLMFCGMAEKRSRTE